MEVERKRHRSLASTWRPHRVANPPFVTLRRRFHKEVALGRPRRVKEVIGYGEDFFCARIDADEHLSRENGGGAGLLWLPPRFAADARRWSPLPSPYPKAAAALAAALEGGGCGVGGVSPPQLSYSTGRWGADRPPTFVLDGAVGGADRPPTFVLDGGAGRQPRHLPRGT